MLVAPSGRMTFIVKFSAKKLLKSWRNVELKMYL
jgi:hypothetical protein